MITILTTTEDQVQVKAIIDKVDRLNELVEVSRLREGVQPGNKVLKVNNGNIETEIDWFDTEPPYLIPAVSFDENNLLALVFYKLGNEQRAFGQISESDELYTHLLLATQLKYGYEIEDTYLNIVGHHNKAVVQHYGNLSTRMNFEGLRELYLDAIDKAENDIQKGYTTKHYLNLLLDAQKYEEAVSVSEAFLKNANSEEIETALWMQWCSANFKILEIPYDEDLLKRILTKQQECIAYLQTNELQLNAALLAIEACDVANFLGDYPLAKDLINTAITTFRDEDVPEFLDEAGLKKAHLLYNWSKNGSPQYYKAAINAFQDVLKVFKKDTHPDYFAEIQHSLALIYCEIPAPPEEKPMWTAFSASSFKEALDCYTEEAFPYEYAMVCHNYATALMNFPPAKLHNNYDRANAFFEDALRVRTSDSYPIERALTLLNQLELGWLMHNADQKQEEERLRNMKKKAKEISLLVKDGNLLARAKEQLEKLEKLQTII